nr:hypothetical protein [Tanacetum cinerariifolium]
MDLQYPSKGDDWFELSTDDGVRNLFPPLDNPELTIRRRSCADPTLLNEFEMVAEGNGDPPVPDLRTMVELCKPSLNGQGGNLSSYFWCMSTRSSARNLLPHLDHLELTIRKRSRDDPTLLNDFEMAAEGNGDPPVPDLRTMVELCGTFMKRRLEECYDLIENMTTHHNDWDTSAQWSELSSSITSSSNTEITALKAKMVEINKKLIRVLQVNQQVKAVTPNCETCSGPHSFNDFPATIGQTQNLYAARAYQG